MYGIFCISGVLWYICVKYEGVHNDMLSISINGLNELDRKAERESDDEER